MASHSRRIWWVFCFFIRGTNVVHVVPERVMTRVQTSYKMNAAPPWLQRFVCFAGIFDESFSLPLSYRLASNGLLTFLCASCLTKLFLHGSVEWRRNIPAPPASFGLPFICLQCLIVRVSNVDALQCVFLVQWGFEGTRAQEVIVCPQKHAKHFINHFFLLI